MFESAIEQIREFIEKLKVQRAEAEAAIREAQKKIEEIDAALPGLERSLSEAERHHGVPATEPEGASAMQAQAPDEVDRGTMELKDAEDIQQAIEEALPDLPDEFTQNQVSEALEESGLVVNRSTLRSNLKLLARVGVLRTVAPGKGRRATIFGKK